VTGTANAIRPARLSDRPALVDLSSSVHGSVDAHRRSLGVPAPSTTLPRISLGDLMPSWIPLRSPSVHLVAEANGELVGSCRAITEPHREDWVIIELDAADRPLAADVRWSLLRALVDEAMQHNVARIHAACSDAPENMELFGQLGFMAYAEEEIWYRPPEAAPPARSWLRVRRSGGGQSEGLAGSGDNHVPALQEVGPSDAWHLFDLWTHTTPPAIARVENYGATDWEPVGHEGVVPRSSLNPLLHFSDVAAWLLPDGARAAGFAQHGACREGPHYLRFLIRDGTDGVAFLQATLAAMGGDAAAAGVLSPVRTYEAAGRSAATDAGFEPIGQVSMLVREVRASVRQPAMVPAI